MSLDVSSGGGQWYDKGDPCGTGPNVDGVSCMSDKPSNTRAMRGWGCTSRSLVPAAIKSGPGKGPKERKDTVSQPFNSTF